MSAHGKPSSLTSIAFGTGVACERQRALQLTETLLTHQYNVYAKDSSGDMYHDPALCEKCALTAAIKEGTK